MNIEELAKKLDQTNEDLRKHYEEDNLRHQKEDIYNDIYRKQVEINTEILKSLPDMKNMIENFIKDDSKKWDIFIEADKSWKEKASPVVEAWNSMSVVKKLLVGLALSVLTFWAVFEAFLKAKGLFK